MIKKIHDKLEDEGGFTLIELLVVVIIIGILAAIAIPTFLSQRNRGWEAELTSAVRNAALEIEAEATTQQGVYPAEAAGQAVVTPFGVRTGTGGNMTLTYAVAGNNFTITATHPQLPNGTTLTYNSASGGLQSIVRP